MIYSTNRTASLGDTTIEVDVNKSYFGAGSLVFMQEAAEDELALFENAITSIINNAPDIVCDLFLMMKREEKNQSFIYALGSALNDEKV